MASASDDKDIKARVVETLECLTEKIRRGTIVVSNCEITREAIPYEWNGCTHYEPAKDTVLTLTHHYVEDVK